MYSYGKVLSITVLTSHTYTHTHLRSENAVCKGFFKLMNGYLILEKVQWSFGIGKNS